METIHLLNMEPEKLMKHSEWLHLKKEGENICSTLRQQNYQCLKQTRRLTWKIIIPHSPPLPSEETGGCYLLTWLPAPVSDWSLIPNDTTQAWEQLMRLVQSTLNTIRGGEVKIYQRIEQPEDYGRPWAIVRLLPDLRHYTVARFHNRTDAQDHLRCLNRFIPAAEFEIIFDVPSNVEG